MHFQPLSFAQLEAMSTPGANPRGNSEVYPYTLFDSGQVANGALTAQYFTVARAGLLTNLPTPGQLPAPQYFQIGSIHVTPAVVITGAADPQQWNDMDELVRAARGTITLSIQNKQYGPWPISQAHGLGGVTGFGVQMASTTAEALLQANNGPPGGPGIDIAGQLVLTPKAQFSVTLNWDRALVLSATTYVQVAMKGAIYQAIR